MAAHPCLFEAFAKSVMSRLAPLTLAQREEMQVLINQGIEPLEARALVQGYVQKDAGFDEAKHPRDHGKFSESTGGGNSGSKADGGKRISALAQRHHENATRSLDRADHHFAASQKAAAEGRHDEAKTHLSLASNAASNARGELTKAHADVDRINRAADAKGQPNVRLDARQHAQIETRQRELRAKIDTQRGNTSDAKANTAAEHTSRAEQALGQSKAAVQAGNKQLAQSKLDEAKASAKQADQALARAQPPQSGAEANRALEAQVRQKIVESHTKEGVDKTHLQQAGQKLIRAKAHETAADKHAKAGHHEQASHHATEAAHNRHEAGEHLAQFGELLKAAADKSLEKSATPRAQGKSEALTRAYLKAFFDSAQDKLPGWQQGHLKRRAQAKLDKALTSSQVHVPVPLAAKVAPKKAKTAASHIYLVKADANEMAYVHQALNLEDPAYRSTDQDNGDLDLPPEARTLLDANRLVQGMDMEMMNRAITPEQARKAASRMLLDRPRYYDTVGATQDVLGDKGVMLDLGSGQSRALGHLGVDLHPYDYGTVLWDLDVGIPFPDGCARAVRMTHSLHSVLDADGKTGNPVPLLLEIQRVLRVGGQFYYEGPEPLFEQGDPWPIPGLAIVSDTHDAALGPNANAPVAQTFRRVPLRVPAFPGADARYAPTAPMPVDVAMAMLAANASPADVAMSNLVGKSGAERVVPIVKADDEKQICYGEVLNPLTIDSQNDWLTAADIEKAAHDYMMTSRVIGSEHGKPIGASVVESFVAPQDLNFQSPTGPVSVPKGTWLIGVKVTDPKEWALVKSGEYSGFSVGGFGVREPGAPNAAAV